MDFVKDSVAPKVFNLHSDMHTHKICMIESTAVLAGGAAKRAGRGAVFLFLFCVFFPQENLKDIYAFWLLICFPGPIWLSFVSRATNRPPPPFVWFK